MADILPYLGVQHNYTEDDIPGKTLLLEDYRGLRLREAEKKLKEMSLTWKSIGEGDSVTGQIPAPGQEVHGGSQVLLYLGTEPKKVTVPSFYGLTRQEAEALGAETGLLVEITGNDTYADGITVMDQSLPPGQEVQEGTTLTLTLADERAAD